MEKENDRKKITAIEPIEKKNVCRGKKMVNLTKWIKFVSVIGLTNVRKTLKLKPRPYKMDIALNYSCNLRCKNCFNWKTKTGALTAKELDVFFKKNGKGIFWLGLTGGEITLRNDLDDIFASIKRYCPNLIALLIRSNGYDTKKIVTIVNQACRLFAKSRVYVTLSLDGPKEIHNYLRGNQKAFDNVKKTHHQLEILKNNHKNLNVEIETTISEHNLPFLEQFINYLSENKMSYAVTFATSSWSFNNKGKKFVIEKDALGKVLMLIKRDLNSLKAEKIIEKIFINMKIKKLRKQIKLPCYSIYSFLTISPGWDVHSCIYKNKPIDNLKHYDFDLSLLLDSLNSKKIQTITTGQECESCWTPCHSYFNIMQSPIRGAINWF